MRTKEFDKVKPYVYWIKNNITGVKYFGVRWANINKNRTPIQDLGKVYFSSGKLGGIRVIAKKTIASSY